MESVATAKLTHPNSKIDPSCGQADKTTNKQTDINFRDVYFHTQEGHKNGFRLENLIN